MNTNQQIAETILEQLGGARFIAMTGARVSRDGASLCVKLPTPRGLAGFGFNVTLNGLDLYDVTFVRMRRNYKVDQKSFENAYHDQLQSIIAKETGLALSL